MRRDLVALDANALVKLTNAGLVNRARREIASGLGPSIVEDANGVVTGGFPDGVIATLAPGVSLDEAPCSCAAPSVCRHRVATVLAYAATATATATASASASASAPAPGVDDAAIEAVVGERAVTRARAMVRRGVVVELEHGDVPTAKLPTCAVRFLVPDDPAYARCDCALGGRCEHVVVACWAFREAAPTNANRVELGARTKARTKAHDEAARIVLHERAASLAEVNELAADVVREGIARLDDGFARRFALARDAAADATWLASAVDDLEDLASAYRARSARYAPPHVRALLATIAARVRASTADAELPAGYVLGRGEARETKLEQVRLIALGARVHADASSDEAAAANAHVVTASVFFADAGAGTVLVLSKSWEGVSERVPTGPSLARRALAGRLTLDALARAELVSRAVKRRANRSMTIGDPRTGPTSILAKVASWDALPPSILALDLAALAAQTSALPPRLLRPRLLAETVRVVSVKRVLDVARRPGAQSLVATLEDAEGARFRLERAHHRGAPHALDVLAQALASNELRFVSGDVAHDARGLTIDPVGLAVGDRLVVPDLESAPHQKVATASLDASAGATLATRLAAAAAALDEVVHRGLDALPASFTERALEAADALSSIGLDTLASSLRALVTTRAPAAFLDAAIALDVAAEIAARSTHLATS